CVLGRGAGHLGRDSFEGRNRRLLRIRLVGAASAADRQQQSGDDRRRACELHVFPRLGWVPPAPLLAGAASGASNRGGERKLRDRVSAPREIPGGRPPPRRGEAARRLPGSAPPRSPAQLLADVSRAMLRTQTRRESQANTPAPTRDQASAVGASRPSMAS